MASQDRKKKIDTIKGVQRHFEGEVEALVERMAKLDCIVLAVRRMLEETRVDVDRMDWLERTGVTEMKLADGTTVETGSVGLRVTIDLHRSLQ